MHAPARGRACSPCRGRSDVADEALRETKFHGQRAKQNASRSRVPQSQLLATPGREASKTDAGPSKSVENRYTRYRMRLLMADSSPARLAHLLLQRLRLHYVDWVTRRSRHYCSCTAGRPLSQLDWTAAALRDDWHVIAPDLRGHGDSQWSTDGSYTMAGYITTSPARPPAAAGARDDHRPLAGGQRRAPLRRDLPDSVAGSSPSRARTLGRALAERKARPSRRG